MINLRRDAKETALCGAAILGLWYVTQLGGLSSAIVYTSAALPVQEQFASPLIANNEPAVPHQTSLIKIPDSVIAELNADVALSPEQEMPAAIDTASTITDTPAPVATPYLNAPIISAALPDTDSVEALDTVAASSDSAPNDVKPTVARLEISDECLDADVCIDRFLWALYQRTPKEDTLAVHERRKVAVKRKGKMVTVTRNFTKHVDQDFTWKDPDAAEKVDMSMMDYVIGGMDRGFKTKLFHTLYAAEQAGMSPGITSAFRDDYRQSIATGKKAATGRSFHGGSMRGGYGHGLAADVVSVDGTTRAQRWVSTEKFWKWIDANGKEFGIGRPYLGGDPPHVGPIDGNEYVSRREMKVMHAMAAIKKRSQLVAQSSAAKTPGKHNAVQASSPARENKPKSVSDRPKMAMAERTRD